MRKWIAVVSLLLLLAAGLWIAMKTAQSAAQVVLVQQVPENAPAPAELPEVIPEIPEQETGMLAQATAGTQEDTQPLLETTAPAAYAFTEEEEQLLLKIGMAERGDTGCTVCVALVMRTVLNRVEAPKFSSTIRGVIYAQDQFTPVAEGTFEAAEPNQCCRDALELIRGGWDESQGALYYEWCEGESWHSRNLKLLFQHCDTRFYH